MKTKIKKILLITMLAILVPQTSQAATIPGTFSNFEMSRDPIDFQLRQTGLDYNSFNNFEGNPNIEEGEMYGDERIFAVVQRCPYDPDHELADPDYGYRCVTEEKQTVTLEDGTTFTDYLELAANQSENIEDGEAARVTLYFHNNAKDPYTDQRRDQNGPTVGDGDVPTAKNVKIGIDLNNIVDPNNNEILRPRGFIYADNNEYRIDGQTVTFENYTVPDFVRQLQNYLFPGNSATTNIRTITDDVVLTPQMQPEDVQISFVENSGYLKMENREEGANTPNFSGYVNSGELGSNVEAQPTTIQIVTEEGGTVEERTITLEATQYLDRDNNVMWIEFEELPGCFRYSGFVSFDILIEEIPEEPGICTEMDGTFTDGQEITYYDNYSFAPGSNNVSETGEATVFTIDQLNIDGEIPEGAQIELTSTDPNGQFYRHLGDLVNQDFDAYVLLENTGTTVVQANENAINNRFAYRGSGTITISYTGAEEPEGVCSISHRILNFCEELVASETESTITYIPEDGSASNPVSEQGYLIDIEDIIFAAGVIPDDAEIEFKSNDPNGIWVQRVAGVSSPYVEVGRGTYYKDAPTATNHEFAYIPSGNQSANIEITVGKRIEITGRGLIFIAANRGQCFYGFTIEEANVCVDFSFDYEYTLLFAGTDMETPALELTTNDVVFERAITEEEIDIEWTADSGNFYVTTFNNQFSRWEFREHDNRVVTPSVATVYYVGNGQVTAQVISDNDLIITEACSDTVGPPVCVDIEVDRRDPIVENTYTGMRAQGVFQDEDGNLIPFWPARINYSVDDQDNGEPFGTFYRFLSDVPAGVPENTSPETNEIVDRSSQAPFQTALSSRLSQLNRANETQTLTRTDAISGFSTDLLRATAEGNQRELVLDARLEEAERALQYELTPMNYREVELANPTRRESFERERLLAPPRQEVNTVREELSAKANANEEEKVNNAKLGQSSVLFSSVAFADANRQENNRVALQVANPTLATPTIEFSPSANVISPNNYSLESPSLSQETRELILEAQADQNVASVAAELEGEELPVEERAPDVLSGPRFDGDVELEIEGRVDSSELVRGDLRVDEELLQLDPRFDTTRVNPEILEGLNTEGGQPTGDPDLWIFGEVVYPTPVENLPSQATEGSELTANANEEVYFHAQEQSDGEDVVHISVEGFEDVPACNDDFPIVGPDAECEDLILNIFEGYTGEDRGDENEGTLLPNTLYNVNGDVSYTDDGEFAEEITYSTEYGILMPASFAENFGVRVGIQNGSLTAEDIETQFQDVDLTTLTVPEDEIIYFFTYQGLEDNVSSALIAVATNAPNESCRVDVPLEAEPAICIDLSLVVRVESENGAARNSLSPETLYWLNPSANFSRPDADSTITLEADAGVFIPADNIDAARILINSGTSAEVLIEEFPDQVTTTAEVINEGEIYFYTFTDLTESDEDALRAFTTEFPDTVSCQEVVPLEVLFGECQDLYLETNGDFDPSEQQFIDIEGDFSDHDGEIVIRVIGEGEIADTSLDEPEFSDEITFSAERVATENSFEVEYRPTGDFEATEDTIRIEVEAVGAGAQCRDALETELDLICEDLNIISPVEPWELELDEDLNPINNAPREIEIEVETSPDNYADDLYYFYEIVDGDGEWQYDNDFDINGDLAFTDNPNNKPVIENYNQETVIRVWASENDDGDEIRINGNTVCEDRISASGEREPEIEKEVYVEGEYSEHSDLLNIGDRLLDTYVTYVVTYDAGNVTDRVNIWETNISNGEITSENNAGNLELNGMRINVIDGGDKFTMLKTPNYQDESDSDSSDPYSDAYYYTLNPDNFRSYTNAYSCDEVNEGEFCIRIQDDRNGDGETDFRDVETIFGEGSRNNAIQFENVPTNAQIFVKYQMNNESIISDEECKNLEDGCGEKFLNEVNFEAFPEPNPCYEEEYCEEDDLCEEDTWISYCEDNYSGDQIDECIEAVDNFCQDREDDYCEENEEYCEYLYDSNSDEYQACIDSTDEYCSEEGEEICEEAGDIADICADAFNSNQTVGDETLAEFCEDQINAFCSDKDDKLCEDIDFESEYSCEENSDESYTGSDDATVIVICPYVRINTQGEALFTDLLEVGVDIAQCADIPNVQPPVVTPEPPDRRTVSSGVEDANLELVVTEDACTVGLENSDFEAFAQEQLTFSSATCNINAEVNEEWQLENVVSQIEANITNISRLGSNLDQNDQDITVSSISDLQGLNNAESGTFIKSDGNLVLDFAESIQRYQNVPAGQGYVVVDGDIIINSNIEYGPADYTSANGTPSVAIIAINGDIRIAKDVTRIDALVIAIDTDENDREERGRIMSEPDSSGDAISRSPLVINGSLVGDVYDLFLNRRAATSPTDLEGAITINSSLNSLINIPEVITELNLQVL